MKETVDRVMTRNIFMIDASSPLSEAKEMFEHYPIRHLPVISEQGLVGIISKADVQRLCFEDTYRVEGKTDDPVVFDILRVEDIMTRQPKVITPTDSIEQVIDLFFHEDFHALPVSDDQGLVGIITTSDIIRYLNNKLTVSTIPDKYSEDRPWGNFEQFCQNMPCTVKIINVKPNEELSLQYHIRRKEFWQVIKGEGTVVIGEDEIQVKEGNTFVVPERTKHRIKTTFSPLKMLEISYGHFDEQDIVRLEDKYERRLQNESA